MDLDEYNNKMKIINERINQISELTAKMALIGQAEHSNPQFVILMEAFENLILEADKLIKSMTESIKNKT